MFYVYILYSEVADRYYVGYTDDPQRRLWEHNNVMKNSYTSRYRPWIMKKSFAISEDRGDAMKVEKHIKKMKSRKELERLVTEEGAIIRILELVRAVPTHRD